MVVTTIYNFLPRFSPPNLRKAPSRFDSDGDGVVTHKELSQALRFIGFNPTEAELQVSFASYCIFGICIFLVYLYFCVENLYLFNKTRFQPN